MSSITTACMLLHLLLLQAPAEPKTADDVMQRVRQATQFSKEKIPDTGLQFTGEGTFAGLPAHYILLFNRNGHFVQTTNARITTGSGFDGTNVWIKDLGGEQRIQELADRNNTIVNGLFATSLWLDPGSGMRYTLEEGQPKDGIYLLHFKHHPTEITGSIQIDAKTWLPVQSTMKAEGQKVTNKWSGIMEFNGIKFPKTHHSLSGNDGVETYTIESIQAAPTFVRSPYAPLVTPPSDVTFNDKLPAELEVMRAKTGHLLVKPKVNGKDVGWFIFDSGAGATCLDTRLIKELELEQFGEVPAIGVGGTVKTRFSKPDTISLGRATFKDPVVIGLDLAFLSGPMGAKIAGVIGYGVFHRCIVELDMEKNTIALFDPKTYDQSRVQNRWQKLYQTARVACVEAEFEGHKGVFKLDTGAAGSTVALHAPTVEKFKLLVGRETTETSAGGVGGNVTAMSGKLKYFELGGHRTDDIEATFATTTKGAFNSADTLGNIGGDLLKPFKIVFDYQDKRIAFVKRENEVPK
ncbi:MAG TPA: retropepsin-like aspartic protease [Gemmatales bacterium]|nr:retropepsin-like aspartic protease [Gemmatales bacterium]